MLMMGFKCKIMPSFKLMVIEGARNFRILMFLPCDTTWPFHVWQSKMILIFQYGRSTIAALVVLNMPSSLHFPASCPSRVFKSSLI